MQVTSHTPVFLFEGFCLDPAHRLLKRGEDGVALHPKAFELLLMLVENRDRVLTKNELMNTIWESQFVEENNLAVQISALRKVFGERSGENRYIVTVPGRGYQFVADVKIANGQPSFATAAKRQEIDFTFPATKLNGSGRNSYPHWSIKSVIPFLIGLAALLALALGYIFWPAAIPFQARQWKLNKLTATGNVTNATISPDGEFIVFAQTEGNGESLWLRQVETGSQTRIIAPEPLEYVGLTISPDNNFIYFSTFGANRASTPLQRIPLLGGASQRIANIESGVSVSFSADGKHFAYTEGSSSLRESYLKIADADGSNPRIVVRAEESVRIIQDHKMRPVAWSRDGGEIALAVGERTDDGFKTGILLVDSNGVHERLILQPRFRSIHSLAWLGKNKLVFVAAESQLQHQIWALSTDTSELRLVTSELNDYTWLSASSAGELLTVQKNAVSSVRIAHFDEESTSLQPREILHETEVECAAFAPDGGILYTSRASGSREIWKVVPGQDPKQITVDAHVSKGFAVSSTDGSLVFGSSRGGKPSLWIADRDGNDFRRLTEGEDVFPQFTSDGTSILFQRGSADFPTVWRVGTDGRSEPVKLINSHSLIPTVAPADDRFAFYFMDFKTDGAWRIGLSSTETGEVIGKLTFPSPVSMRRMSWHPSGKFIGQVVNTGEAASLLLMPTGGGEAKIISGLGNGRVNSLAWSADGKMLVYALTVETQDVVSLAESHTSE